MDSSIEMDGNMRRVYAIVHCKESLLHLGRGRLFFGGGELHSGIFLCMCRKQKATCKVNRNLNESYYVVQGTGGYTGGFASCAERNLLYSEYHCSHI